MPAKHSVLLYIAFPIAHDLARQLLFALDSATMDRRKPSFWAKPLFSRHMTLAYLNEVRGDLVTSVLGITEGCLNEMPKPTFSFDSFQVLTTQNGRYIAACATTEERLRDPWTSFIRNLRNRLLVHAPQIDDRAWFPHVTLGTLTGPATNDPWNHAFTPIPWTPTHITVHLKCTRTTDNVIVGKPIPLGA